MSKQRKSLQVTTVKTLLAILLFTGMGTIIIGGGYIISKHYKNTTNNQPILLSENISLVTDKTEYQTGEEVKLTIENNLDEEIEFYVVVAEKFNNNKWEEIRFDIECLGLCMKIQTVINPKNNKSFLWDQKDNIGSQIIGGKFRFKIGIWDNAWNSNGLPPIFNYYSNEFTIKSDSAEVDDWNYCEENSDCVPCGDNCISIERSKYVSCEYFQDVKCVCVNNKCIEKSLGSGELFIEDIIQSLIQQMGDDNVSQKIKNEIPEKLYNYGKEAIPYLIEALDDERVFGCFLFNQFVSDPCRKVLVKEECKSIIYKIIEPLPPLGEKHFTYEYYQIDLKQWWEENQDKSLNEIRKMVRDYYRVEEEKNNYPATGYREEEYDYLDFIGDLTVDDWEWDIDQNCHGLREAKQCDYLDWPISYGCRVAESYKCYNCIVSINGDVSACEKIILENKSVENFYKNGCYHRAATVLNRKGMNDKIDFCDKFKGEWEDLYREKCLKLAKK